MLFTTCLVVVRSLLFGCRIHVFRDNFGLWNILILTSIFVISRFDDGGLVTCCYLCRAAVLSDRSSVTRSGYCDQGKRSPHQHLLKMNYKKIRFKI